ncbi:unnamed protein product [Candidula unifasciata]|uniref:Uncharacterized protein n=1 Tax=Candidula unifasciata TaxID=100452 RepID=A0A8S3YV38_9EUPU|nr:unnamed protein product [Candidula unifasciata]
MGEFQRIRPFKILAVVMVTIAVVLTVASLAGHDWVRTSFYDGKVQSWGLWWKCFKVHSSFQMCVSSGWLSACAAMVFLSLISNVVATGLGVWGLCAKRRLPYVLAGAMCIISGACQLLSVVIYPIMFTHEIRSNPDNKTETSTFSFAWTYGIACGTIFFVLGASVFFLIRLRDEDDAQPMKSSHEKPTFYTT